MCAEGEFSVAAVLLDSRLPQLDHLFDYRIPAALQGEIRVGQRVKVPLRGNSRSSFGWVIELKHSSDYTGELAVIDSLVTTIPLLTREVWQLVRAAADRAAGSACDIIRLAIPARHVRAEKQFLAEQEAAGQKPAEVDTTPNAEDAASPAETSAVLPGEETPAGLLLGGAKLAMELSHGPVRLSSGQWVGGWAERLSELAGVIHQSGHGVIICVPDYRDLEQLTAALTAQGVTDVVRVDAKQSKSDRYLAHLKTLQEQPTVIVGNRSAVYAAAHKLAAVLVWDDSDPLFAEPLSPYVHTRDAALLRSQLTGCGVLFAGHVRSIEMQRFIDKGLVLAQQNPPRRVTIRHADAGAAPAFTGRIPSVAVQTIRQGLKTGPVLVQVIKPGYSSALICQNCRVLAGCKNCSGPLKATTRNPECSLCSLDNTLWQCRNCRGVKLAIVGPGSERTAADFKKLFPGVRILVSDGKTPISAIDSRPAIVVATPGAEPIAAGGYRATVLLDAERMLSAPTLKAAENTLRWWENAAAKTAPDGLCLLASGSGPVVQAFLTGQISPWLQSELQDRNALRYPPAVRVAELTGTKTQVADALAAVAEIPGVDNLGMVKTPNGEAQSLVRFGYSQGKQVATALRAQVVTGAAGSKGIAAQRQSKSQSGQGYSGQGYGGRRSKNLRLRFDDVTIFDDLAKAETLETAEESTKL